MKHVKPYKLFESVSHELPKYRVGVRIFLTSVESDGDDFAGHWGVYHHDIKMEILSNVFSPDEAQVLDLLDSGQFTFGRDDYDWCPQVEGIFSKDNISQIASTSEDVGSFIDTMQSEIYQATVDYYSDLLSSREDEEEEEEEEDDNDDESGFMNLDALSELTHYDNYQGVEYSSADPEVEISDDTISVISDEIEGEGSLDDAINRAVDEDGVEEQEVPVLLAHLSDPTRLDSYIKENPMDIDLLNGLPEVKTGVLRRTGLKDISVVAKTIRRGLI